MANGIVENELGLQNLSFTWSSTLQNNGGSSAVKTGRLVIISIACNGTVKANGEVDYLFDLGMTFKSSSFVRPFSSYTNNSCRFGLTTDGKVYINGASNITSTWSDSFRGTLIGVLA